MFTIAMRAILSGYSVNGWAFSSIAGDRESFFVDLFKEGQKTRFVVQNGGVTSIRGKMKDPDKERVKAELDAVAVSTLYTLLRSVPLSLLESIGWRVYKENDWSDLTYQLGLWRVTIDNPEGYRACNCGSGYPGDLCPDNDPYCG